MVSAVIGADPHMFIAIRALAMHAQGEEQFRSVSSF